MIRTLALCGVSGARRHPFSIAATISYTLHPRVPYLPLPHQHHWQDSCSKHQQESSRQQAGINHSLTGLLTTLISFQAKCIGTVSGSNTAAVTPFGPDSTPHEDTAGSYSQSNPPLQTMKGFSDLDANDSSNSSNSSSTSSSNSSSRDGSSSSISSDGSRNQSWGMSSESVRSGFKTGQAARRLLREMQAALGRKEYEHVKHMFDPQLAEEAGTVDASKMYLNVLKAHAALREGPLAAALVKNMRAIGLAPGHLAYIQVVFAFCRAGALQDALWYLQTTVPRDLVNTFTVNSILMAACTARQPQLAVMQQCLDLLHERGLAWDTDTWRQIFRLQAQAGDVKGVMQTKTDLDDSVYSHSAEAHTGYVRALCSLGKLESAAEALHHMLHFISPARTAAAAAAATTPLADAPAHQSSHSQFGLSQLPSSQQTGQESQSGLDPSQAATEGSFSQQPQHKGETSKRKALPYKELRLVQHACHVVMIQAERRGQLALIVPILSSMQEAGVSVDSAIQSCVMRVATQQGKTPAQLEEYLLRLLKLRVKPSEQTFNALLRAHLAHGDAAAANRILDQMGAQGLVPKKHTFNALLEGHATSGNVGAAVNIYKTMQERGIKPDHCTFIALFKVIRHQSWAVQRLRGAWDTGVSQHERFAEREASSQLLSEWVADMKAAGLKHNGPSLTVLVQAYGHTLEFTRMVHLLRASWDAPGTPPPSLLTYSAAITACCRGGHLSRALRLLHEMRARGLAPNLHTYTSLLSGCGFARDADTAHNLWCQMKEEGWVPNECTYNAKVKVHSSVGDFDAALDTVQQMQAQGFPPGKAAWAVIMPMAQAMGRHDIVQQVQQQAAGSYGWPAPESAKLTSDKTDQDTLQSLQQCRPPKAVHADEFVDDLEGGGWSSGFDDSDDDIIGGSF